MSMRRSNTQRPRPRPGPRARARGRTNRDLAAASDDLDPDDAVLLRRGRRHLRRDDRPAALERGDDAVRHGEGREPPVFNLQIFVKQIGDARFDFHDLAARDPAEEIQPVDPLVDQRAAGHDLGSANQPGFPELIQSSAIDQREV